jgi:hypothetical protein
VETLLSVPCGKKLVPVAPLRFVEGHDVEAEIGAGETLNFNEKRLISQAFCESGRQDTSRTLHRRAGQPASRQFYWCPVSRGDRIRTCGLLVPNQTLYQAELRPGRMTVVGCGADFVKIAPAAVAGTGASGGTARRLQLYAERPVSVFGSGLTAAVTMLELMSMGQFKSGFAFWFGGFYPPGETAS